MLLFFCWELIPLFGIAVFILKARAADLPAMAREWMSRSVIVWSKIWGDQFLISKMQAIAMSCCCCYYLRCWGVVTLVFVPTEDLCPIIISIYEIGIGLLFYSRMVSQASLSYIRTIDKVSLSLKTVLSKNFWRIEEHFT